MGRQVLMLLREGKEKRASPHFGHLGSNVQEGGLRAMNEVIGALLLPQLGATPFLRLEEGAHINVVRVWYTWESLPIRR